MNKNTLPDTKFFFTRKICFSFAVINFCPVLVPYINIFQFVEGAFVTALRNGDWILLDEVNLAPPKSLQRVIGVLEDVNRSLWLAEGGVASYTPKHPNFRLDESCN